MSKFLDEKNARKIFEEGFIEYDWKEMVAYSRFAYKYFDWSALKIENKIRSIFKEKGKNLVPLIETIKSAISKRKFDFLENDLVVITDKEIEKIKLLKNRDYQKATLSLLIMAKHKGMFWNKKPALFGSKKEFAEVIRTKMAIYFNKKEFDEYSTYIGKEVEYVQFHISRNDVGKWICNFSEEGKTFCKITDFTSFKNILPFWCKNCGKVIPRGKYCENCK